MATSVISVEREPTPGKKTRKKKKKPGKSLRDRVAEKKLKAAEKEAEMKGSGTRAVMVVVERVVTQALESSKPKARVLIRVEGGNKRDVAVVSRIMVLGTMMYAKRGKTTVSVGAALGGEIAMTTETKLPYVNPWRPPTRTPVNSRSSTPGEKTRATTPGGTLRPATPGGTLPMIVLPRTRRKRQPQRRMRTDPKSMREEAVRREKARAQRAEEKAARLAAEKAAREEEKAAAKEAAAKAAQWAKASEERAHADPVSSAGLVGSLTATATRPSSSGSGSEEDEFDSDPHGFSPPQGGGMAGLAAHQAESSSGEEESEDEFDELPN